MQSRLETLNLELAEKLNSMSVSAANREVMLILSEKLASLPVEVVQHLPKSFEIQSYTVSQEHVDALDDRYFSEEKAGNLAGASASFMAARLLSAVMSWQGASNHFDLCEAAYEAHFSHG